MRVSRGVNRHRFRGDIVLFCFYIILFLRREKQPHGIIILFLCRVQKKTFMTEYVEFAQSFIPKLVLNEKLLQKK